MDEFKLGEIVVGQNFVISTHKNGMEGTIIGPLAKCEAIEKGTGRTSTHYRYEVEWANGDTTYQRPKYLRKLPPPQKTTTA